jgi:hypothetical protein
MENSWFSWTTSRIEHQWGQTYTFDKMWIIDRVANLGKMIER